MNIIFSIKGREAVPVRAIPFVTGWSMSPEIVASSLAHKDPAPKLREIAAYHLLVDDEFAKVLPKEWDGVEAELQNLSDTLKAKEVVEFESYPTWRHESILLLPAGLFVWKDEFIAAFASAYAEKRRWIMDERPGDRELNFTPLIPQALQQAVVEGFSFVEKPAVQVRGNFQNGEFQPLNVSLAGYWATPFDQLPDAIKPFALELEPMGWNDLDPQQRQSIATKYDWQRDPRCEPSLYWELTAYQSELEQQESSARGQTNYAVALALVDVQKRIDRILGADRGRVGGEIQGLRELRVAHQDLLASFALLQPKAEKEKPLDPRRDSAYLNTIAILLEFVQTPRPDRESAAAVINEMVENYKDAYGISKAQLEKTFAAANRNLKAN